MQIGANDASGGSRCAFDPPYAGYAGWTGGAMLEAAKGFRRLKARKQLPILRAALTAHQAKNATNATLEQETRAA